MDGKGLLSQYYNFDNPEYGQGRMKKKRILVGHFCMSGMVFKLCFKK
jgi:hypothetical protein